MESPLRERVPDGTLLIETFALGPDLGAEGVARLDLHMARMAHSARALGFSFDEAQARALLAAQDAPAPRRARLTLSKDGALDLTTAPMPPAAEQWRFAIHPTQLASDDMFLRHKTTQRALYDVSRTKLPNGVDEWVFLNERGEICEGTITNIALRIGGAWLTPPITSGCLPGTYRQHLLDQGRLEEAVLHRDDLLRAEAITLMNALRGEIAARLQG